MNRLTNEGYLDEEILNNSKYSGSIIGGIEFWGRTLVELEVKDYTIHLNPINDAKFIDQIVPVDMVAGRQYEVTITMKNIGTTI